MQITAQLSNQLHQHTVTLSTAGREQHLAIAPKAGGYGSSVNGGELLLLALATCFCNDVYREAANRGLTITAVEVDVSGAFGEPGEPAQSIRYGASVEGHASEATLLDLLRHTDTVAEIQNTLRLGIPVELTQCTARELPVSINCEA